MTWQLGAFAILALAIAAGFAWYERARPDARIIALVGTLAAFAALGRIAFAALPNVKPTTDIVLISGYALGGAPGFAVGAIAGLTSNFFFGQGPWTPWQMAAWGATGALGAGLAALTGRRIGRWPLALACFVVGYAFAAIQDLGDWVTYSDHSLAQLGVYVGKGTGFDFVHAAGCFAFALALGPSLTRSLRRFSARLQVTWRPPGGLIVPALIVCLPVVAAASLLAPAPTRAAGTPAGYLVAAQNRDGGFGSASGQPSAELYSGWAALGLAAAGYRLQDVDRGGSSVLAYVRGGAGSISDVGALERTILVVRAAGLAANRFGGHDLVMALQRDIRADGSVADQVNLTSFAVLALRAAGVAPPGRTLSWVVHQQNRDGGFSFATAGATSDVDDTAAALEALAAAGGSAARSRERAIGFIESQQDSDGGFPSQPGSGSNAQSTAWAVQGLLAGGVAPGSLHRGGAASPMRFLRSLVGADGHVSYSRGVEQTPVWVTGEALMALAGKPLPLVPPAPVPPAPARVRRRRSAARATRPAGRQANRHHRPAAAHARRPVQVRAPAADGMLGGLAIDAGLATALILAPLGLG